MGASELNLEKIKTLGLNPHQIAQHQRRVKTALSGQTATTLKIIDTCRLDNAGILPAAWLSQLTETECPFVAFVPAAGAASRYFAPFADLRSALLDDNKDATVKALNALRKEGADQWALPTNLKQFIDEPEGAVHLTSDIRALLLRQLSWPKAFLPADQSGESFLRIKAQEHEALEELVGQVFVAPYGKSADFRHQLGPTELPLTIVEQGPELSTIRFNEDGSPFCEDDGGYSLVPAGHGTLTRLFPKVHEAYPGAKAVFIRNIDNVVGNSQAARTATKEFLATYSVLLKVFNEIRAHLAEGNLKAASNAAQPLLKELPRQAFAKALPTPVAERPGEEQPLWELLYRLLQTAPEALSRAATANQLENLREFYGRPLNLLGQVPNTAHDVGGTPVFVETPEGPQKVCLELPHASKEDIQTYLANPAKATHFNPVFACAEIMADMSAYEAENSPYWIMASKNYQGRKVFYHETVLYELIGNNAMANALFMEIPRLLFHPHKSLQDSAGKK